MDQTNQSRIAVFGAGCFWCTEAVFDRLRGVISVMPGYSGGAVANPTYRQVCGGRTGHAEVARIEYDPAQISYDDLLTVFFGTHDPTSLNRQGADVGTEYRSAIFYTDDDQRRRAEALIEELSKELPAERPIVTEVVPLTAFYPAEDYHREYFRNNPMAPYCQFVIHPKIAKLQRKFSDLLKKSSSAIVQAD